MKNSLYSERRRKRLINLLASYGKNKGIIIHKNVSFSLEKSKVEVR